MITRQEAELIQEQMLKAKASTRLEEALEAAYEQIRNAAKCRSSCTVLHRIDSRVVDQVIEELKRQGFLVIYYDDTLIEVRWNADKNETKFLLDSLISACETSYDIRFFTYHAEKTRLLAYAEYFYPEKKIEILETDRNEHDYLLCKMIIKN